MKTSNTKYISKCENFHTIIGTEFKVENFLKIEEVKQLNTKRLLSYMNKVRRSLSYYKKQSIGKTLCCEKEYYYHPHYDYIYGNISKYISDLETYFNEIKKELSVRENIA